MKPEEAILYLQDAVNTYHNECDTMTESNYELNDALKMAKEALEKQVAKKSKEVTWERLIERIKRNTYEVEHEMLDPEDNSVAGDEIISVVSQSYVLGLMYSIAEGKTIILPPE